MDKDRIHKINNEFVRDIGLIWTDVQADRNHNGNLETLNDTLTGLEIQKVLHEDDLQKLDTIAHVEAAVLRIKVKLLERLISNTRQQ